MGYPEALRGHLSGGTAITQQCGDRITPILRESRELPALTYQLISGLPDNSLDGFTSGTWMNRTQIDCWAETYDEAQALASAVHARMNAIVPSGSGLRAATLANRQDLYESETKLHRVMMDFNVRYRD